jgi:hypothetical protein
MVDQPAQEVSAEQVMAEIGNMQTQIQNLQLRLQTARQALLQQPVAATPAPQPTLKLSQPDKYGGRKGYVSAWLSMIEDAFVETHTDAERIRWATSFLSDNAAIWWTHVKYSDDRPLTWDHFKESITNHFESSRRRRTRKVAHSKTRGVC